MVRLCVALLERLTHEPWSMYRAKRLGGPEHFGITSEYYALANAGDLIQVNTIATVKAAGDKKSRRVDPMYRPELRREQHAASLTEVDYSFFN